MKIQRFLRSIHSLMLHSLSPMDWSVFMHVHHHSVCIVCTIYSIFLTDYNVCWWKGSMAGRAPRHNIDNLNEQAGNKRTSVGGE